MVPGFELEKDAAGDKMSHQQSEKQSFPYTTQNWIAFGRLVLKLCSFTFLCAQSLCRSSYNGSWKLAFPDIYTVILAQPPLLLRSGLKWAELQARGRTVVALCFCNWNSGTIASGKTRVANKTIIFTTAWCLHSARIVPLAMKC